MFTLAIHGGAGTINPATITPAREAAYRTGLATALRAGHDVLADGGTALDAVTSAVMALEDDPLFNAGRGAVYTSDGKQEMDAAVMRGQDRGAGAVAGIFGPRNPILAARAVMERSESVLLMGQGALDFLRDKDLTWEGPEYFHTGARWQNLQDELARRAASGADTRDDAAKHGTVGAVARDQAGNIAAATSTGGMTGKPPGRVGDSPLVGAGTWADNATCAISATGAGEYFIRWMAAHEIASRMRYLGLSLAVAADQVVTELGAVGGSGGLIAIDVAGNVALPFNCSGMYRGMVGIDGILRTGIYRDKLAAMP